VSRKKSGYAPGSGSAQKLIGHRPHPGHSPLFWSACGGAEPRLTSGGEAIGGEGRTRLTSGGEAIGGELSAVVAKLPQRQAEAGAEQDGWADGEDRRAADLVAHAGQVLKRGEESDLFGD
jgi:hypothetical protein